MSTVKPSPGQGPCHWACFLQHGAAAYPIDAAAHGLLLGMLLTGSETRIAMGKASGMIQLPWHGMAWSSSPQASISIYLQSNHEIIRSRRELLLEHPHLCVMQSLLLALDKREGQPHLFIISKN